MSNFSQDVDRKIASLTDWRGKMLSQVRTLIKQAVPEVSEECKWIKPTNPSGVPTWLHNGILCTGESYKDKIKLTFAKGAALADPAGLFNASLDGNVRRAIDLRESDTLDATAFKALVKAAAELNAAASNAKKKR